MSRPFSRFRSAVLSSASLAALCAAVPSGSHAAGGGVEAEEVLITGSRGGAVRTDLLGSSFDILSAIDLRDRQTVNVSDVLRDIPGIAVNRLGTAGNFTQARIRGAEGNHTLVLIDGIEAGDPFSGEFDFATLIADEDATIEVLRGQQSALYGSGAVGGVVHYITATGAEAPGVRVRAEGGSFDTLSGSVRAAGVVGALDYAFSGSLSNTGGSIGARNGVRHDASENESFSGKMIYAAASNLHVTAVGRYSYLDAETTPQDFDFPPGPNYGLTYDRQPGGALVANGTTAKTLYGLLRGDLDLMDGQWTHGLSVQGVSGDRKGYGDTGALSSANEGTRVKGSYATTFTFGTEMLEHAATFAADFKRETYRNKPVGGPPAPLNDKRSLENTGFVGQYDVRIGDDIGLGLAVRHDINQHFKNATTYRIQGSYRPIEALRLRAASGSGITNPTNFELFGFDPATFIGNPDLKPERSEGWEAGFDYDFLDGMVSIGATYFDNTLEDEIFTQFTPAFLSTPQNRTTDSTEEGVEVFVAAQLGEQWRIDASWTNLTSLEGSPPVEEVRRPQNVASLNIAWRAPDDQFGLNLTVRYNGEQRDFQFTPLGSVRVPMPEYTLVNLGGDFRINDTWQLYGRVENLFDEDYEEVFAFPAAGRGIYAGIHARFE